MRITFYFDRNKPFARIPERETQADLVERYTEALAASFRERYPNWEIVVWAIDTPAGDVEFAPEEMISESDRLAVAVEMKRIAHQVAGEVFASYLRELGETPAH